MGYTFTSRKCSRCGIEYLPTNGRQKRCNACRTDSEFVREQYRHWMKKWRSNHPISVEAQKQRRLQRARRRKYSITEQEYQTLLIQQNNRCAICKQILTKKHVDHNHQSGQVRGILCPNCNLGLGMVREDPEILKAMIDYLQGG